MYCITMQAFIPSPWAEFCDVTIHVLTFIYRIYDFSDGPSPQLVILGLDRAWNIDPYSFIPY